MNDKHSPAALRIAAALSYDPDRERAPRLTAKGRGCVADKIIETARRFNIPITEDPALATVLAALDIDQEIPPELYRAVAEILAFLYSMNDRYRERNNPASRQAKISP
ncbi:MAG: EscU/YscU/HrcU family type III secretion system export apparatus switch protein [Deltaproteobacteria bacterium]|nr:EscU/YscU/HrcU family type III secretion system export apparatus switch protein [Deltaproteobacteria bacterium]